jgi:hypothetical protein
MLGKKHMELPTFSDSYNSSMEVLCISCYSVIKLLTIFLSGYLFCFCPYAFMKSKGGRLEVHLGPETVFMEVFCRFSQSFQANMRKEC